MATDPARADPIRTGLRRDEWSARAADHRARIDTLIGPYLNDRRSGATHPVIDFLFTYYSTRPSQLTRWHPGYGTTLLEAPEYADFRGYEAGDAGSATVGRDFLNSRLGTIGAVIDISTAIRSRRPLLGCFGLHEWAMVYRSDETRHPHPLRLGAAGTDEVVESSGLRCTHFDAFRFFTEPARPRNATELTHDTATANEQPGCLHATMDLYRYGLRLSPLISSSLLADCFETALRARELDMRAGPYDLSGVLDMDGRPYTPVPIETPHGRAEYIEAQTALADRGSSLREAMLETCRSLLSAARPDGS